MLGFIPLMILLHINRVFIAPPTHFLKRALFELYPYHWRTDLELYQLVQTRVDDAFNKRGMQNPNKNRKIN